MDLWLLYCGHIGIYLQLYLPLVNVSVLVWCVLSHSHTFLFLLQY